MYLVEENVWRGVWRCSIRSVLVLYYHSQHHHTYGYTLYFTPTHTITRRYSSTMHNAHKVLKFTSRLSRDSLVYCVLATFPLCTYIWTNHSFNASRQEPRPPRYTASWRRGREAGRIVGRTEAHFPAVMALTAPPMYCAS